MALFNDLVRSTPYAFEEIVCEVMRRKKSAAEEQAAKEIEGKSGAAQRTVPIEKKLSPRIMEANKIFADSEKKGMIVKVLVVAAIAFAVISQIFSLLFSPLTIVIFAGALYYSGKHREALAKAQEVAGQFKEQVVAYHKKMVADGVYEQMKDSVQGTAEEVWKSVLNKTKQIYAKISLEDAWNQMQTAPMRGWRCKQLILKHKSRFLTMGYLEALDKLESLRKLGGELDGETEAQQRSLEAAILIHNRIGHLELEIQKKKREFLKNPRDPALTKDIDAQLALRETLQNRQREIRVGATAAAQKILASSVASAPASVA